MSTPDGKTMPRTGAIALTFLGTRGEIDIRSRHHWRHSALLVEHNGTRIMIDCGTDWLRRVPGIAPTAIILTHAHPDHAGGLAGGVPCPVYATRQTLRLLERFPIADCRELPLRTATRIGGVTFKAYPVQHSIRAPAVGYRVSLKKVSFFYLPDVAAFPNASRALRGVGLYIGDGATITRSMVRKKHGRLIGHAPITSQLGWCESAAVHRAVFTHCGSPIVRGDMRTLNAAIGSLGRPARHFIP
jgi:phosphoribosyl 1,2-cyclic phosphodiesterase